MFCPNCGKELPDGARFCAICGTALGAEKTENTETLGASGTEPEETFYEKAPETSYEEGIPASDSGIDEYYSDEPAPKKNRKPLIIALCAIVAAVIVVVALAASGAIGGGKPADNLQKASANTLKTLASRSEVLNYFGKAAAADERGLKVTFDDLGELIGGLGVPNASYLNILNPRGEIELALSKKGNAYAGLSAQIAGVELGGGYYADSGKSDLVLNFPMLLKEPYGISLSTMSEDLEGSIFAPDSGSDYSLPEDQYEEVQSMSKIFESIGQTVAGEDLKLLRQELEKDEATRTNLEKSKGTVNVGDQEVRCDIYTTTIDREKLTAIMTKVLNWYGDRMGVLSALSSSSMPVDVEEMIRTVEEQMEGADVSINVEYDVCKGYLVRTNISSVVNGQSFLAEVLFGSDPSKTEAVTVKILADNGYGDEMQFNLLCDLTSLNDEQIRVRLDSDTNGISGAVVMKYDKEASSFEITTEETTPVSITGGMTLTEDTMRITDPVITVSEETLALKGISIEFTTKPEIRKVSDDYPNGYHNILTVGEDDMEGILKTIQSFSGLMG